MTHSTPVLSLLRTPAFGRGHNEYFLAPELPGPGIGGPFARINELGTGEFLDIHVIPTQEARIQLLARLDLDTLPLREVVVAEVTNRDHDATALDRNSPNTFAVTAFWNAVSPSIRSIFRSR